MSVVNLVPSPFAELAAEQVTEGQQSECWWVWSGAGSVRPAPALVVVVSFVAPFVVIAGTG